MQIQDIVRRRQLLTIFREGKDGQQDVDVAILQALLKGACQARWGPGLGTLSPGWAGAWVRGQRRLVSGYPPPTSGCGLLANPSLCGQSSFSLSFRVGRETSAVPLQRPHTCPVLDLPKSPPGRLRSRGPHDEGRGSGLLPCLHSAWHTLPAPPPPLPGQALPAGFPMAVLGTQPQADPGTQQEAPVVAHPTSL